MNFTGKKAAANPPEKETYFRHPKKRHQEEVEKNIKKEEKRVDGKPSPCYTRTIEKRTKSPRCTLKTEQRFAPEFPAKGHLNRNGRSWYKKSGSMLEQYKLLPGGVGTAVKFSNSEYIRLNIYTVLNG